MDMVPPEDEEQSMQSSSGEPRNACATLTGIDVSNDKIDDRASGAAVAGGTLTVAQIRAAVAKRKFEEIDLGFLDSPMGSVAVRQRRGESLESAGHEVSRSTSHEFHTAVGAQEEQNLFYLGDDQIFTENGPCTGIGSGLDDRNSCSGIPDWQVDDVSRMNPDYTDIEDSKSDSSSKVIHSPKPKDDSSNGSNLDIQGESFMDYDLEDLEQIDAGIEDIALSFVVDGQGDEYMDDINAGCQGTHIELLEKGKDKEDPSIRSLSTDIMVIPDTKINIISDSYADMASCYITHSQSGQINSGKSLPLAAESSDENECVYETRSSPLAESSKRDNASYESRLQFFVKTILGGPPLVLLASLNDTVESVHHQIHLKTGLPTYEQRLIYCGKQMQKDQTLSDYKVTKDATLQLVGRMRSTALPQSWQLISDLVATIRLLYSPNTEPKKVLQDKVCCQVKEFLKMGAKTVPSSEHMQVFQLTGSGATLSLVMLLLSPFESNRRCAEECIKLFTSSSEEYMPNNNTHFYCAPILLEFCKLLSKSAPSHELYTHCRSSLAQLLDNIGSTAHRSPYFNDAKPSVIVQEFAPFIEELANKLVSNLKMAKKPHVLKDKSISVQQHLKEGQDFTAFVISLCKAMDACNSETEETTNCGLVDEKGKKSVFNSVILKEEIGSQKWLVGIFKKLLTEIDSCLEAVEDIFHSSGSSALDSYQSCGALFLVVLKGLHAISKLFSDRMREFLDILKFRRVALNVLVGHFRWTDDHFWLLDYGYLLDFDSKKRLLVVMLPEPNDDHDERQEVMIQSRAHLLSESFESLAYVEPDVLQGGISVEFMNEEATGPGVLREWFSLVCHEIFNPQNALFVSCPHDRRRFFPNPASGVNTGHLTYFKFCGRYIALALMHKVQIDVVFAQIFFKQLAGQEIGWEDTQDADPSMYSSCKKILDMDAELFDSADLSLTFVTDVEELGSRRTVELCPGGKDITVTSKNRHLYVKLLIERRFVTSVTEQVKCFAQGFSDLLVNFTHEQFFKALELADLDLMIHGDDRGISINEWKAYTEYHDYAEDEDVIKCFWQVVEGMSTEKRRKLLFFSTSVSYLPADGFKGLSSKFHIHRAFSDEDYLPTAHTCFFQLVLPPYSSLEIMHSRLHTITEAHVAEGFGFA